MNKTRFAGLTRLDPSDPLSTDSASFQSRNPNIEDRLLEIGAVTHRHDDHAALGNPSQLSTPSGTVVASGGNIPSDFAMAFGYTLNDADGGETTLSGVGVAATAPGYDPPASGIEAAVDYLSGALVTATYHYGLTMLDGEGGETALGPVVDAERQPGFASAKVTLSGLSTDLGVNGATAWGLYRAMGGGNWVFLGSGTADTFVDNGVECVDCSRTPPDDLNQTTNQANTLLVKVPTNDPAWSQSTSFNLYLTIDGDFGDSMFIGNFPLASGGLDIPIRQLDFAAFSPPDVSTSIHGAHKIDPDTELLDWHWKRPVVDKTVLPAGTKGDVRLVTDSGVLWGVLAASAASWTDWSPLGGGGGGSGTISRVFDKDGHEVFDPAALEFVGGSAIKARVFASGDTAVVQLDTPFYITGDQEVLLWSDGFTGTIADLATKYESDGYLAPDATNYSYAAGGLERIGTLGTSRLVAGASATGFLATDTRGRVKVKHLKVGGDYNVTVGINRIGSAVTDQTRQDFIEVLYEGSTNWGFPRLSIIDSPGPSPPTFFDGSTIGSAVVTDLGLNETGWVEIERVGRRVTARWYTSDPDLGAEPATVIHATITEARRAHLDASPAPGFFGFREGTANMLVADDVKFWAARQEELRVKLTDLDRLVVAEDGASDFFPTVAGSGGSPRLTRRGSLEFAGSGGVGVSVTDRGGGSAFILIGIPSGGVGAQGPAGASGAPGPQGPPGTGGGGAASLAVAGSGGVPEYFGRSYLEFAGSGGTAVAVRDLGGSSAQVLIGAVGGAAPVIARTANTASDTIPSTSFANLAHPDQVHVDCGVGSALVEIGGKGQVSRVVNGVIAGLFIDGVEAREVRDSGVGVGALNESSQTDNSFWSDGSPNVGMQADSATPLGSAAGFNFQDGDGMPYVLGPGAHTIEFRYKNLSGADNGVNIVKQREIWARATAIGGASASVAGSAIVGPAGPPGADGVGGGHTIKRGSGGAAVALPQETNLAFGSGLAAFDDPADNTTEVEVKLVRNDLTIVTGSLGSGWQASGVVGGSANIDAQIGRIKGELVYKVASDRPMRIRVYAGSGQRLADASRAIGTDPTGDHGVLLDFVTTPADLDWTLSPMAIWANTDLGGQATMPIRIDNLGALGSVQATLTLLPLEF